MTIPLGLSTEERPPASRAPSDSLPGGGPGELAAALAGLDTSPRLAQRRFGWLPVTGPGSVYTGLQGRGPGESTSLAGLGELISSIAVHGVLAPILVEELTDPDATDGRVVLRLVTGEGRLRSCRIGLREAPENTHFQRVPAMICPGPLTDEERNAWQLVENLARQDYQPGELASALLLERCAVLAARLAEAGAPVPAQELADTDDPVARWTLLEKTRQRHAPQVGAPWELVLRRLGVSFGSRKARQLVAAFQHLPRELSTDLDAHKIALTTRTGLVRLARDPRQSVEELWTAVKALGRPELLAAATAAAETAARDADAAAAHTTGAAPRPAAALPPMSQAVQAAVAVHEAANASRSEKLTHHPDQADLSGQDPSPGTDPVAFQAPGPIPVPEPSESAPGAPATDEVAEATVTAVLEGLRSLIAALRAGQRPPRFVAGSLTLLLAEVTDLMSTTPAETGILQREAG